MRLDPTRSALVVVDMQNDFCRADGYYARRGRDPRPIQAILAPTRRLLERTRARGIATIYSRYVYGSDDLSIAGRHGVLPGSWIPDEPHLVEGTPGAEIVPELAPRPEDLVVDKSAYSCFYGTDFEARLRQRSIDTLVLTGSITYCCVLHTAFDAFVRGFNVLLVSDSTGSWSDSLQDATEQITDLILGRVVTSDEVMALFGAEGERP